ncbi:MAG: ACP S-malonyltransferase [Armatimonadota bacterium]|nr:ACP S-malonyltransferase [Armatimonadota bacterium]
MREASKLAYVFSPQGSQTPGMGKDLHDNVGVCKQTFESANDALGFDLTSICFNGPDEDLRNTEIAQPALLTVSTAALRALQSEGFAPSVVAGHSVGEYAALVAAGALAFEDAVRLVRRRGQLMSEAGAESDGAMAAIIGLTGDDVKKIVADAAGNDVLDVANYNSPEQTVISGERAAVERARELAKERGAKRALPLNVSGAFHSRLMAPAAAKMETELAKVQIHAPEIPIVANATAEYVTSPDEIRRALVEQLAGSVRWVESVKKMVSAGCGVFVEAGVGQALAGMVRRIDGEVEAFAVSDCASLKSFVESVGQKV